MDELTLDGKTYISSKQSAKITGYAKDYIGQLCREGRVEARLVGRNWYVLESSIREHRFGPETPPAVVVTDESNENVPESDWKAANYVSETVSEITTIPSASPAIEEMQSAWQDWFTHTNELKKAEESLESMLNDSEEVTVEAEVVPTETITASEIVIEEAQAIEETPIAIERITEEETEEVIEPEEVYQEAQEEEVVPIHRTFSTPPRFIPPSMQQTSAPRAIYTPLEVSPTYVRREMPVYTAVPEGRIIRERRVMPKKKSNIVLQTLFILVAVIAAAAAVVGSGKVDQFVSQNLSRFAPIQYIDGQSSFDKTSK